MPPTPPPLRAAPAAPIIRWEYLFAPSMRVENAPPLNSVILLRAPNSFEGAGVDAPGRKLLALIEIQQF